MRIIAIVALCCCLLPLPAAAQKVSTLAPALLPYDGSEIFYLVQKGVAKKGSLSSVVTGGFGLANNNTQLRSLVPPPSGIAHRSGFASAGDGGAADYLFALSSTCVDDGGSCIAAFGGGRWLLFPPQGGTDVRVWGVSTTNSDNSAQAQNALNYGGDLYVRELYNLATTLNYKNGTRLMAPNFVVGGFRQTTANQPVLQCDPNSNITGGKIENLLFDRLVTATSGGDGFYCPGATGRVYDNIEVHDNEFANQWNAARLGVTDQSKFYGNFLVNNFNDGVLTQPYAGATAGSLQWGIYDNIATQSGGNAYEFNTTGATLASGFAVGDFDRNKEFASGGNALRVVGTASAPIAAIRPRDFFFGNSCGDAIFFDSHNLAATPLQTTNGYIEAVGTTGCGRNQATPATHTGSGIHITANNNLALITGNLVLAGNSDAGLWTAAVLTKVSGVAASNNGVSGASATPYGFYVNGANGAALLTLGSNTKGSNLGGNTSQTFGAFADDGHNLAVGDADLSANATASFGATTAAASIQQGGISSGTWSPVLSTDATPGAPTYSFTPVGSWDKSGRHVTARFNIATTAWPGSPTGHMIITGLPFTVGNVTSDNGVCSLNWSGLTLTASYTVVNGNIPPNTTTINLAEDGSGVAAALLTAAMGTAITLNGVCDFHT